MIEPLYGRRQHLHQLLALLLHVAAEHPLERGVEFEELLVEEHRRIVGNQGDGREAVLHERFLGHGQHLRFLMEYEGAGSFRPRTSQCDGSGEKG